MSRTVRCEQVVLGWSHYSLLGGDGFGPVFASAGWPLPPGDRDAGLGDHARFLSSSGNSMIAEGRTPPRCLAYAQTEAGTLLISKAYAARSSRSGQYLVHALLDPSHTLRPQDLFACADKGLLLDEQPAGEADRDWPPVDVPLTRKTPEPALDAAEESALAVLLDCLSESRTMVVQAADPARANDLVRRLLTALPARLARNLSLSTFASEPDLSGLDLCVGVPPFSSARRIDVDLDAGGAAPPSPTARVVAAALVAAEPQAELDQAETVQDLVGWAQLSSGRLSDLSSDGIQRLLSGPMWRSFLEAVDRTGPTSLLLDCLLDPEIAPVLGRRLARPNRALSDQLARALAQPVGLDVRGQGQLQDQLIAVLGMKEFQTRVLPGVLDLARQGVPVKIASTPLADLVAEALTPGGSGCPPGIEHSAGCGALDRVQLVRRDQHLVGDDRSGAGGLGGQRRFAAARAARRLRPGAGRLRGGGRRDDRRSAAFAVRTHRTVAGLAGRRPGSAGERSAGDGADHPAVHPRRSRRP